MNTPATESIKKTARGKKKSPKAFLVCLLLLFPSVILALFATYHGTAIYHGKEVILPIYGYDPRDLLSGHYLTFRIDFSGVQDGEACRYALDTQNSGYGRPVSGFYCSEGRSFSKSSSGCKTAVFGTCTYRGFDIGVNRFYIPEEYAETLDLMLRRSSRTEPTMKIVLSVTSSGKAYAKDLLIEDRPWKEWIRNPIVEERPVSQPLQQPQAVPAAQPSVETEEEEEIIILPGPETAEEDYE